MEQRRTEGKATANAKRRRNPAVARYLGLGASAEPECLKQDVKLPKGSGRSQPGPVRKRRKLNDNTSGTGNAGSTTSVNKEALNQRRVSAGLRVTKPRNKFSTVSKAPIPDGTVRILAGEISQGIAVATSTNHPVATSYSVPNMNDCDATELDVSDWPQSPGKESIPEDENFDDDLNDDEFLSLTSDMIDIGDHNGLVLTSPDNPGTVRASDGVTPSPGSSATMPVILETMAGHDQPRRKTFNSPVTLTTRLLAATSDLGSAKARKPIVRPPFPATVRDHSPIIGLTSTSMLRTCFRIGEAVNQAHQASKSGKQIVFELYARILDSERNGSKQDFTFCDLFHAKPPYIKGVYDGALWKSVQLFNYDSARLLQQGRICRCMGKMQREGKEWVMTVLNIWEATWHDVRWVEGIVNS